MCLNNTTEIILFLKLFLIRYMYIFIIRYNVYISLYLYLAIDHNLKMNVSCVNIRAYLFVSVFHSFLQVINSISNDYQQILFHKENSGYRNKININILILVFR